MFVPVESVAVRVVSLLERLVVHGVFMTGEGPLVAKDVVEEDEVPEDVFEGLGVEVNCDCASAEEVDEVSGLKLTGTISPGTG